MPSHGLSRAKYEIAAPPSLSLTADPSTEAPQTHQPSIPSWSSVNEVVPCGSASVVASPSERPVKLPTTTPSTVTLAPSVDAALSWMHVVSVRYGGAVGAGVVGAGVVGAGVGDATRPVPRATPSQNVSAAAALVSYSKSSPPSSIESLAHPVALACRCSRPARSVDPAPTTAVVSACPQCSAPIMPSIWSDVFLSGTVLGIHRLAEPA